jgi:hypothetical protein
MGTLVSPTLGGLLASVRRMLRQPDPSNSEWSDDTLIAYLNEGIRVYMAEASFQNEGLFTGVEDLDIVANQETVALPADFFEARAVYRKVTDGYVSMPYQNSVNEDYYTNGGGSGEAYVPAYHFRNNSLVLRPTPNFSETDAIRLEYLRFPETLINGGDRLTSDIAPLFKQVIETYAVKKAKFDQSLVNGSDVGLSAATNHFNELYAQFKECIRSRSKYPQYTQPYNPEGV